MSKYRTAYAPEFSQQLIELVHAGRSANDVAKEFGLHATTVAKWVRLSPMGVPAACWTPRHGSLCVKKQWSTQNRPRVNPKSAVTQMVAKRTI